MKTSRIVLVLGSLLFLGSCDLFGPAVFCAQRHVNVIVKGGSESQPTSLKVSPGQIDVKQGCSFEIWFPAGESVKTSSGKAWLTKGLTGSSPIIVTVPDAEPLGVYKYDLEVDGFGLLDPRARVK
jgi:hypothetical protein